MNKTTACSLFLKSNTLLSFQTRKYTVVTIVPLKKKRPDRSVTQSSVLFTHQGYLGVSQTEALLIEPDPDHSSFFCLIVYRVSPLRYSRVLRVGKKTGQSGCCVLGVEILDY